jgi:hypothetical protein
VEITKEGVRVLSVLCGKKLIVALQFDESGWYVQSRFLCEGNLFSRGYYFAAKTHHRDTENTERFIEKAALPTFGAKPCEDDSPVRWTTQLLFGILSGKVLPNSTRRSLNAANPLRKSLFQKVLSSLKSPGGLFSSAFAWTKALGIARVRSPSKTGSISASV